MRVALHHFWLHLLLMDGILLGGGLMFQKFGPDERRLLVQGVARAQGTFGERVRAC